MMRLVFAILVTFGISGCGGGGSSSGIGPSPPSLTAPDATENHGEISVSYGQTPDPSALGVSYLASYLTSDANDDYADSALAGRIQKFETPPTIRVAAGTPPELVAEVARVVKEINTALPNNWQIHFSKSPAPVELQSDMEPEEGEIHVQFSSREEWETVDDAAGLATRYYGCIDTTCEIFAIRSGRVHVDPSITTGRIRERVIAHELLHTLGRNHIDPARFPDTIMDPSASRADSGKPILEPLDREALLAVYGRLGQAAPTDGIEDSLGPWATDASHVRGDLTMTDGDLAFGASARNGRIQPWITGPQPDADITDNDRLAGSAAYAGRLLGFTNDARTIAGRAALSVRLATLEGNLSFAGLETWQPGMAPGRPGTGTAFGTSLNYGIVIRGNTFVQIGGDAGTIDGRFLGGSHQGMGGIIRREDFAGAFAGTHQ